MITSYPVNSPNEQGYEEQRNMWAVLWFCLFLNILKPTSVFLCAQLFLLLLCLQIHSQSFSLKTKTMSVKNFSTQFLKGLIAAHLFLSCSYFQKPAAPSCSPIPDTSPANMT